jgi:hypothetical protein
MAEEIPSKTKSAQDKNNELLRELIRANNRTTHAVRAIVLPSTRILVGLLIALPSAGLGFLLRWVDDGGGFFFFVSGAVLLGAAIWAIVDQVRETKLSKLPGTTEGPYSSSNWTR